MYFPITVNILCEIDKFHFISLLVNCVWGFWSSWSSCAVTCGGSVQLRARLITTHSDNGGTCSGDPVESQACATTLCAGGNIPTSCLDIKHINC